MMLSVGGRDLVGVSVAAAAALAIAALPEGPEPAVLAGAAVVALAAWIALQDLADFTIPDGAVAGLALIGLARRWALVASGVLTPTEAAGLAALDVAMAGGGLWLVREAFYRRRGYDGLGFGDVKLGAAGGLLVGMTGFSVALVAASLAGVAVLLLRHGRRAEIRTAKLAFGALLAPATALVFLLAPDAAGGLP